MRSPGLLDQALGLSHPNLGANGVDPADPLLVDILHALALVAARSEMPGEALSRHEEALALARRIEPRGGWATVHALRLTGAAQARLGKPHLAEPLRREADEMARDLPPETGRFALPHPAFHHDK